MPDQLTESHAHLENDCTSCHAETEQQSQNSLCVGCHVSVGADVESGQGFHGRHPDAGQNECASCHTDHEGREADIVGSDDETFDHSWTDMMLRSAHVMLFCSDCHAPGIARNAAPNTCVGCHVQDDVHLLQMGATCNDCHNETNWRDAT
ncbi:MAG: cytochrome c3 family protein, partial [Gammaproteobacteria bacterium]